MSVKKRESVCVFVCVLVPDSPLCQVPLHELTHYYLHPSAGKSTNQTNTCSV